MNNTFLDNIDFGDECFIWKEGNFKKKKKTLNNILCDLFGLL